MEIDYKKGDKTDENKSEEITTVNQNDDIFGERPNPSFYDELSVQKELFFSDNEESINQSLNWFADMLHVHPFQIENEILDRMIELVGSENNEISNSAQYTLFKVIRSKKNDIAHMLDNRLLEFILDIFPSTATFNLLTSLINVEKRARIMLLDMGIADRLIDIMCDPVQSEFLTEVGDLCSALVSVNISQEAPEMESTIIAIFSQLLSTFVQHEADVDFAITVSEAFSLFIESSPAFFNFFIENNLLSNMLFFPSDDDSFVENMMHILSAIARNSEQGAIYVKDNKGLEFAEHYMDSPCSYVSATAIHVLSECLLYIPELSIFYIQEKIILKAVQVYSRIQENEDRNDFEYDYEEERHEHNEEEEEEHEHHHSQEEDEEQRHNEEEEEHEHEHHHSQEDDEEHQHNEEEEEEHEHQHNEEEDEEHDHCCCHHHHEEEKQFKLPKIRKVKTNDKATILVIKAILRLAIFEIVFVPSSEFEAIVLSHIYNILFENVPLTSDKDVFFTVNALLRVYEENCDVKWKENGIEEEDDYEKPPEINYDLVEWLEDHLQTDNEKLKASINTLLFAVKHETPTQ